MDTSILPLIGVILLAVALSACFAAAQTAFQALNPGRLKSLAFGGNLRAEKAYALMEQPEKMQGTLSGCITFFDICAIALGSVLLYCLMGGIGAAVSILLMLVLQPLMVKSLPRALAYRNPEQMFMKLLPLMRAAAVCFAPWNGLYLWWERRLEGKFRTSEAPSPEEELITMVDQAQSDGDMDIHEGELIRSAIEFNDLDARDILTPRVDVVGLEFESSMEAVAQTFREFGYSRLPVYKETMDNIVGILHEKDYYVGISDGKNDIASMMKPPVFAPATIKISKLLRLLQNTKTHIAVIVDEFGGTEGIVTLEDVLEELVGEIYDEHDDVLIAVQRQEDGSMLVDGGADLDEILNMLNIPNEYEADTVGGWVAEAMGRIPQEGETIDMEGIHVQATRVEKRRVQQIRIEFPKGENQPADGLPA